MEADFLRYYHLDLWAELGGPRLPWCRFRVLADALPWDSAYARSATSETAAPPDLVMLAAILDHHRLQSWANGDPAKRGAKPSSLVDAMSSATSQASRNGLAQRLQQIRQEHAAQEV